MSACISSTHPNKQTLELRCTCSHQTNIEHSCWKLEPSPLPETSKRCFHSSGTSPPPPTSTCRAKTKACATTTVVACRCAARGTLAVPPQWRASVMLEQWHCKAALSSGTKRSNGVVSRQPKDHSDGTSSYARDLTSFLSSEWGYHQKIESLWFLQWSSVLEIKFFNPFDLRGCKSRTCLDKFKHVQACTVLLQAMAAAQTMPNQLPIYQWSYKCSKRK